MQKYSILDAWRGSEFACVQIAPDNVLCHHNKNQVGYFEFLNGSRIIYLPLNWQHLLEKLREAETHRLQRGPPPFFHSDTHPVLDHVLVHSVGKTHVVVVIVKLIWLLFLNILCFNFVPTPNKSLRFTRFRRSYVNRHAVVLTNHCQNLTTFLLDVRCSKCPFFEAACPKQWAFV